jgi:hypothetical protein
VTQAIHHARRRGDRDTVRTLRKQQRALPSVDPDDPGYRRLRYIRYADDHLLGFTGPKAEAEEIKRRLAEFLRDDLKLELSADKTLITHARTGAAKFLSYEITVQHNDTKTTRGRRSINGGIGLGVPAAMVNAKRAQYLQRGKPTKRTYLMNKSDYTIIGTYGAEYRGFVEYYLLAGDVNRLNRLRWDMERSMLKTLAAKHQRPSWKLVDRYKTTTDTPYGKRRCFEARGERTDRPPLVARFGGIPLRRNGNAVINDRAPVPGRPGKQLIQRLLAGICEVCAATDDISVHHVRRIADLAKPGQADTPAWVTLMSTQRRTTLVVCARCHSTIHKGCGSPGVTWVRPREWCLGSGRGGCGVVLVVGAIASTGRSRRW